ncbi:hypothetical protein LJC11_05140 [Bacteroidales bacterium OttesenSCG-928-I21]|nr:hypothetical protein [Bacteroidales bacterium OttesenSCG-928-I21]
MKKLIILIVTLIGLFGVLSSQVSDNFMLTTNDLIISTSGEYDIISTTDFSFTDEIGSPQLPVKFVSFVLPYNSTITGLDVTVTQQKLNGNYYIYPAQPPRMLDGSDPPEFVESNLDIYNSNEPYPNKTVEIISDGYTHGYHVVTVAIYPVEYHPANREVYLRNINFTINYNGSFDSKFGIPFQMQSYKRAELGNIFA